MVIKNPTLLQARKGDLYISRANPFGGAVDGYVAARITEVVEGEKFSYNNPLLGIKGEREFGVDQKDDESISRSCEVDDLRAEYQADKLFRISLRALEECDPIS